MERAQRRAGLPITGDVHICVTGSARASRCKAPAKAIHELAGHANLTKTMRSVEAEAANPCLARIGGEWADRVASPSFAI